MDEIDELLDRFEREIRYFEETRDLLEPVMSGLLPALETYFNAPSPATAAAVRPLRATYVARLGTLDALLRDWVAIRGSGQRALEATLFMSPDQAVRHDRLCAREFTVAAGREWFDTTQTKLRRLLLLFDETAE